MLKNYKVIIILLVAVVLFVSTVFIGLYSLGQSQRINRLADTIKSLEQDKDKTNEALRDVQARVKADKPDIENLTEELESLRNELTKYKASFRDLSSQIKETKSLSERFIFLGRTFISLENKVSMLEKELKDRSVDLGNIQVEKEEK